MSKHKRGFWVQAEPEPARRRLCPFEHTGDDDQPAEREVAPGLAICRDHRRQLARDISRLPDLHDALGLMLHPDGPTLQPFTTGQGETAPFVNDNVARLRGRLVDTLTSWTAFVCDERKVTAPSAVDPGTLAGFLAIHVHWIAGQEWAHEPVEHFHEVAGACFAAAYPTARHRVICGRCLEVTSCDVSTRSEMRCTGQLVVEWTEPADLEPEGVDCTVCGKTWPHRYWTKLGRQLQVAS